jgi:hypothetical protein
VSKHVSPLGICVVGDNEAGCLDLVDNAVVKEFQHLNRFAARSSAHVENPVPIFGIQKSHRHHRNFLLSEDSSILSFVNNETMKLFKFWRLAKFSPSHLVESKHGVFLGVPQDCLRLFISQSWNLVNFVDEAGQFSPCSVRICTEKVSIKSLTQLN